MYIPSITYSFSSLKLFNKALQQMQKNIKGENLPKYDFNRATPIEIVYGNDSCTWIEMKDLVPEGNTAQISHLLMALRTEGITQDLSLIVISWM